MRHHEYNPKYEFFVEPEEFDKFSEKDFLQYCLGATLYMPGTRQVTEKILKKGFAGLTSMVMCFEDSVSEEDVPAAEQNVLKHLGTLASAIAKGNLRYADIPLTFLRVRNTSQFRSFIRSLDNETASVLTGFVFPKFYSENGFEYFSILSELNSRFGLKLYGMPIIEGYAIAFKEQRIEELSKLRLIFRSFKDLLLNVRVGGTDFSSIFGVRRGINYSIYDILTVRDVLSDVLNFFGRYDENYVVSAPVWEYFLAHKTESLDQTIARDIHRSILQRNPIINEAIDGLLREVVLDKANGFVGKTIIHPSHVRFVNAMQAVTKEEYDDAVQVLTTSGGVIKAASNNKMNEINPHRNWASKTALRAKAFGVLASESEFVKLMGTQEKWR